MHEARGDEPADANAVDVDRLHREVVHLRAENARLHTLLGVTGGSVVPQGPDQSSMFVVPQGHIDSRSGVQDKLALYRALFAGRSDVYALRWQNDHINRSGWVPAVQGGWRKQQRGPRVYLPLTEDVLTAHLTGELHAGRGSSRTRGSAFRHQSAPANSPWSARSSTVR